MKKSLKFSPKQALANNYFLLVLFLSSLWLVMCSSHEPASKPVTPQTGVLEGSVRFGPLLPGPTRRDQQDDDAAELYASHKIIILSVVSGSKIAEVPIDREGKYRIELAPGPYWVDFTPRDIGLPESNPKKRVTVESGQTTRFDLLIDTGIR